MQVMEKREIARNLCEEGHNTVICGQAGTGKTCLLGEIAKSLRSTGKTVFITATTGIASTGFGKDAMTVHRWAGIDDGRYSSEEIVNFILNSPNYQVVQTRLLHTDVLIIDEMSMLSSKMFTLLEQTCSAVRKCDTYFGGIQVILAGDFLQLPPVPNRQYGDTGEYCFESPVFQRCMTHMVNLTEPLRQRDKHFCEVIQKVSKGNVDADLEHFMKSVERPLNVPSGTKLFANNLLVDRHNREQILQSPGELIEYCSTDSGETKLLSCITAPAKLWLKVGCPVVLLRNLSPQLVNGLQGTVQGFGTAGPVVQFPKADITTELKKVEFSVYNPQQRKNLATRTQHPLKLAYALTVHKAQGMTLDSVEIDCQDIFQPGQLGVGIGRVRSADDLRVINFKSKYCIPHPQSVSTFLQKASVDPHIDLHCCRGQREMKPCLSFTVDAEEHTEEVFDDEFDLIAGSTEAEFPQMNVPKGFSVSGVLNSLKPKALVTDKQVQVNDILSSIDLNSMQNMMIFCKKEFAAITEIIGELGICEEKPEAVKPCVLNKFYELFREHELGLQHKLNCILCFPDVNVLTDAHWYVTYQMTVEIRKFCLSEKEKLFCVEERDISQRDITQESRARVRYVGGYCVSKVRKEQMSTLRQHMFATGAHSQQKYHDACSVLAILDTFVEDEYVLLENSIDIGSLQDIVRKQDIGRGLTHITDPVYLFFITLCKLCLTLLVTKNLNVHGEQVFQFCINSLASSDKLTEQFSRICQMAWCPDKQSCIVPDDNVVASVLDDMTNWVSMCEQLFTDITKKFLLVMLGQFRSDLLQSFQIEKSLAHRKKVQTTKGTTKIAEKHSSPDLPQPGSSSKEGDMCCMCQTVGSEGLDWIECSKCKLWWHRHCAGLKDGRRWRKYAKGNVEFHCMKCT